jgi:hypothetical protein
MKSPLNRLFKLSQIKSHKWFDGFSWENLFSLDIEPPYIPTLSKSDDKNISPVAFVNYIKSIKEWNPIKPREIERKRQEEFDLWFKNF